MPSLTPMKVYLGTPGTHGSPTQAYQVPTGEKLIIKQVRVSNNTNAAVTFSMITGTNVAGPPVLYFVREIPIAANDVTIFEITEVLEANERIWVSTGTAAGLTVQISGIEVIV